MSDTRFRKILCAVKLTDPGDAADDSAILEADRHARAYGAELVFLHVIPNWFGGAPMTSELTAALVTQHTRLAAKITDDLAGRAAKLTARRREDLTIFVEVGVPHVEIVRKAEELSADLVVVAAGGGGTGPGKLISGRVATQVLRTAHSSVLIARPPPQRGCMVVGTDLSERARVALTVAGQEASQWHAKLIAVYALEWLAPAAIAFGTVLAPGLFMVPDTLDDLRRGSMRRLEEELAATKVRAEPRVVDGAAAAALVDVAKAEGAELVIVAALGRSGIARLLLGSVAEAVSREAPCSVLVVRPLNAAPPSFSPVGG